MTLRLLEAARPIRRAHDASRLPAET